MTNAAEMSVSHKNKQKKIFQNTL